MLREQLQKDLKEAMLAKDSVRLNTVRMIKKYVQELETSPGHTGFATDEEVLKIIQKLVKQGKDSQEQYVSAGREDLANEEGKQLEVLYVYLPKQLSKEEIEAEIDKVMEETGLNKIGPLMKELNVRLAGKANGKTISAILKEKLS